MVIRIITSCTGEKAVSHAEQLTLADFKKGPAHVAARESQLSKYLTPAIDLYSGLQHQRLLRGIKAAESSKSADIALDLWIVSAGYGLIPGDRRVAPYEATFIGMSRAQRKSWARQLQLPSATRSILEKPAGLIFVLLGDDYLDACEFDAQVKLGGPCILFCGGRAAKRLPELTNLVKIELGNKQAKQFSCGLVGLKGEMVSRALEGLSSGKFTQNELLEKISTSLDLFGKSTISVGTQRLLARPNEKVDQVIQIPDTWWNKPHRERLMYFIPEWDDLVDAEFDFENDTHSGGSGDWSNEVYAHQIYPEPNYDGILISKVVAEKGKKKKERINRLGVHRFLRVPRNFPIMGDCGAFGYILEKHPPYTTDEIIDYYTRLDFDLGVSVDHLIVTATDAEKRERYDLTIENASKFLSTHQKAKLRWTPIGAVQGWDAESYAAAATKYVAMGYKYIGLGGLVRSSTQDVLNILRSVHDVVPKTVKIHLFGLARLAGLAKFSSFGVSSVDSASFLRQAWMRTKTSYVMPSASYAALRIPETDKSFRTKHMTNHTGLDHASIARLEQSALKSVREYAARRGSLDAALNAVLEYDRLVTTDRIDLSNAYRNTLESRPWEQCDCTVCKQVGVEVVIFRGNNRNRRRGFHNTYVFYRLLHQALKQDLDRPLAYQQNLFVSCY
jgi:queuine/archaeosine tRNA-ribosyltransferase